MPKTKFEAIVFTAITAWMIVYVMTLYNTVLATSSFTNSTFLIILKSMWIEFVIIFLCAYFISSKVAKYFAFKVVQPTDRGIVIVLMIQVFTVISLASILGVYHSYGFDTQFIPHYLITYCRSFMIALPVQLFIVGAMARYLFRVLFSSTNGVEEEKIEKELFCEDCFK